MKFRPQLIKIVVSVAFIAVLLASSAPCTDKEKTSDREQMVAKNDLPAAILAAFEKSYPKAIINEIGRETKDSTTTYEIESLDGNVKRTVAYTADAKVTEIEEVIAVKELPEVARQAISKTYPKGKLQEIEKVTRGDVTTFEVLVVTGNNHTELIFDSTGTLIKSEKKAANEDEKD